MSQGILSDFRVESNKVISFEFRQSDTQSRDSRSEVYMTFEAMYQNLDIELVEEQLLGSIDLCIRVKGTENGSEKEVFFITVSINGRFSADEKAISVEMFEEMVCINGIVVMLHQARAFISATTALAGITPPILVPMVNVYELNRAMKGSEDDIEETDGN